MKTIAEKELIKKFFNDLCEIRGSGEILFSAQWCEVMPDGGYRRIDCLSNVHLEAQENLYNDTRVIAKDEVWFIDAKG